MSPIVVFNELWLLSERDASARQLKFHPRRNLLAGSNGTGKSRVLKHLVWALGCDPARRAAGEFDSNVVAALELASSSLTNAIYCMPSTRSVGNVPSIPCSACSMLSS